MIYRIIYYIYFLSVGLSNSSLPTYTISDSLPKNMPIIKSLLWGEKGTLRNTFIDPKSRLKELEIRHNMLQLHQKIALFTLGSMVYQYQLGHSMSKNSYSSYTEIERKKHMNLGYLTFGCYMTAASLSILSPPGMKYTKKNKLSNMKLHRYLAIVHFTGMIIQPYLGYQSSIAGLEGRAADRNRLLENHATIGSITTFSYILSFLTTLF